MASVRAEGRASRSCVTISSRSGRLGGGIHVSRYATHAGSSRGLPAGLSTAQAAADARAAGNDTTATLIESQNVVPGAGVDFAALGRVLMLVVAIYVAASLLAYLQGWLLNGIVQRTIATLRRRYIGHRGPYRRYGLIDK